MRGQIVWTSKKDRSGRSRQNQQKKAKIHLKIANKSRKINRRKLRTQKGKNQ